MKIRRFNENIGAYDGDPKDDYNRSEVLNDIKRATESGENMKEIMKNILVYFVQTNDQELFHREDVEKLLGDFTELIFELEKINSDIHDDNGNVWNM